VTVTLPATARAQDDTMSAATATAVAETGDLVAALDKAGNYKTLVNLLNKANLTSMLQGSAHFTVFAPTDEAFAKVPVETMNEISSDSLKLKHLLMYHMISGDIAAGKLLKLKDARTMYEGQRVTLMVKNTRLKVNGATVIQPDIKATNGLVQGIDSVLMPEKW
jgi:uncharacterized surface protein with fasciclin (FAS1) repeats